VKFEWDERKRKSNLRKHLLDFADAEKVFAGPIISILDERENYDEDRWFTLGLLEDIVVAIAHTDRGDRICIISMRKAERYESETYFSQITNEPEEAEGDEGFGD
jgi:hypothetical protein